MSTESPDVLDHVRRTEDALRFINRYWRGGGVPRRERQDRLAELRLHLEEATAHGRDVADVTGPDLAAFAAEWMQADKSRPWLDVALRVVAVLALSSGMVTLLGPVAFGLDRYAIRGDSLLLLAIVGTAVLLADIIRMYRGRLDTRTVALLYIAGVLTGGVIGGYFTSRLEGQLIELSAAVGVGLVVLGAACGGVSWRMRQTSRTRR